MLVLRRALILPENKCRYWRMKGIRLNDYMWMVLYGRRYFCKLWHSASVSLTKMRKGLCPNERVRVAQALQSNFTGTENNGSLLRRTLVWAVVLGRPVGSQARTMSTTKKDVLDIQKAVSPTTFQGSVLFHVKKPLT